MKKTFKYFKEMNDWDNTMGLMGIFIGFLCVFGFIVAVFIELFLVKLGMSYVFGLDLTYLQTLVMLLLLSLIK